MALTVSIDTRTWKKCCPFVVEDLDRCGGLTVCNLKPVMPDEFDDIYLASGIPRTDAMLVEAEIMGKACFPRVNGMYDWIAATRRNWKTSMQGSRTRRDGRLEYEPFVKMARKGPINNQYWLAVYAGAGTGDDAGTESYVITSLSDDIPATVGWFYEGLQVYFHFKANDGSARPGQQGTVFRAEVVGSDLTVWITPSLNQTMPGVGAASDVDEALLTRGLVNVSDYEAFCDQIPALNTRSDALFFVGDTRVTFCESELTQMFLKRVLENKYYQEYIHVPEVEYNRQIMEDFQRREVESFMWGRALNSNQSATNWDALPTITLDYGPFTDLPGHGSCVGRRANPVGIIPQLDECGRVLDMNGAVLNLNDFFDELYILHRVRSDQGVDNGGIIEVGMNSRMARNFQQAMLAYYKARSMDMMRFNYDLKSGKQNAFGFYFTDYILDFPQGVTLRVVTHPYFDDYADAMNRMPNVDQTVVANQLWLLDWSTIYKAVLQSSKQVNTTGSIEDLAKVSHDLACTMKTLQTTYRHTSEKWTAVAECPLSSLFIHNLSFDVPSIEGSPETIGIGRVPWQDLPVCETEVVP